MSRALVVTEPGLDAVDLVGLSRSVADAVEVVVLVAPGSTVDVEPGADATTGLACAGIEVAEVAAAALAALVEERATDVVVLPATARFREIAPLLTARLDAACAPDVVAAKRADGILSADRLLFGGVAVATVQLQRPRAVLTAAVGVRAADKGEPAPVRTVTCSTPEGKQLLSQRRIETEGDLAGARRIVAFGRGLRAQEDITLIEQLAKVLDAEIGCSRPIVEDLGWLTLPHQVGLTGTSVRPDLYLAVGISGQIQHLVGMRDSKVIVAINTNPAAPIFGAADLAVVGDLYEIVPRLIDAIKVR